MDASDRRLLQSLVLGGFTLLTFSCVHPPDDPISLAGNRPPVIQSLAADPPRFPVGASASVTVTATDPDNQPLTYRWRASTGDIIGDGPTVLYSASFCCAGPNFVQVTVRDNAGGEATQSVDIFIEY
jgi:Bacterial Ig domain